MAMGRGALRVSWRCASTSSNSGSGSGSAAGIRGSSERSAQMWNMQSCVRDVLLCKADATGGKKLWKFVKAKCKLSLTKAEKEEFIEHPEFYIDDKKLYNRIVSLPSYTLLKEEFKNAMELQEAAQHLGSLGIIYLHQWKKYRKKDTLLISDRAKGLLNSALAGVSQLLLQGQLFEHLLAPNATVLDGLYDSVCNASWSYVVKSPDGVPDRLWLEVRKEPHSLREWTDEEVDYLTHSVDSATAARIRNTREKELMEDEDDVQSTQGCVVMKVLTSPKGWPYGLHRHSSIFDCFVTKEVERVWRVVKGDLRDWFEADSRVFENPWQRVLIGTPGIGKSMGVGSYLLHQLLQYDTEKLPVVAYFISKKTYIFNKREKQVTVYNAEMGLGMVEQLADNYNGFTIYDCSKKMGEPPLGLPDSWGTVVISTPDENNFKEWAKQKPATNFIINCPEERDIKAMCVWMKRDQPGDLRKYWKDVIKNRMSTVGPIPRFIFTSDGSYNDRCEAIDEGLRNIDRETVPQYYGVGKDGFWQSKKVTHTIVKITRLVRSNGVEIICNKPICPELEGKIRERVSEALKTDAVLMAILLPLHELIPRVLETVGVEAFKERNFVDRIHDKLTEFHPKDSKRPGKHWTLYEDIWAFPDVVISVPKKTAVKKTNLQFEKLYIPSSKIFPVVDAFFFVKETKTIVGIQVAKSKYHDTTTIKVNALREYLAALFVESNSFLTDFTWEIVYVQHKDNKTMTHWQECKMDLPPGQGPAHNSIREEHLAIAKHWNEEVYQYHLKISSADIRGDR